MRFFIEICRKEGRIYTELIDCGSGKKAESFKSVLYVTAFSNHNDRVRSSLDWLLFCLYEFRQQNILQMTRDEKLFFMSQIMCIFILFMNCVWICNVWTEVLSPVEDFYNFTVWTGMPTPVGLCIHLKTTLSKMFVLKVQCIVLWRIYWQKLIVEHGWFS